MVNSFKDLTVWQKAIDLVDEVYKVTKALPKQEAFGLISQLQRASVSIPSNIAEGSRRSSRADFRQFCTIARGSAAELETQLIIVKRLYPATEINNVLLKLTEVQKMLNKLVASLKTKNYKLQTTNYKLQTTRQFADRGAQNGRC